MTPEQYHTEIMQSLITSRRNDLASGELGDEAAALIVKMIGVNALSEDETRNVLSIVRAAFEQPDRIPQEAKSPSGTLRFLRNLADSTDRGELRQEIDETIAFIQSQ